jgi:hypothetical protein
MPARPTRSREERSIRRRARPFEAALRREQSGVKLADGSQVSPAGGCRGRSAEFDAADLATTTWYEENKSVAKRGGSSSRSEVKNAKRMGWDSILPQIPRETSGFLGKAVQNPVQSAKGAVQFETLRRLATHDENLQLLIASWESLLKPTRAAIMAIVRAAASSVDDDCRF